jgi:DNA-binding NarL/FixJ family response regulator
LPIRVLIADDHRLILEGIRRALASVEDIEVVGEAQTGSQVLPLVLRTDPDVVLLDLRMPELDGLACLDAIRSRTPKVKVVVLSAFGDPEHIQSAFSHGATAYIVKSVNPVDLPSALRQAVEETVFRAAPVLDGNERGGRNDAGLTERELAMLRAVARGLSNQAIGKEFWVTEQTVKFHLTNIYRKLGVANRTEATRYAYQHGLVESYG